MSYKKGIRAAVEHFSEPVYLVRRVEEIMQDGYAEKVLSEVEEIEAVIRPGDTSEMILNDYERAEETEWLMVVENKYEVEENSYVRHKDKWWRLEQIQWDEYNEFSQFAMIQSEEDLPEVVN